MAGKYIFDRNHIEFRKVSMSVRDIALKVCKYALISISLASFYYIIFSFFVSTDTEKRLQAENRMFSEHYKEMVDKEKLLGDVVSGLQIRDDRIYRDIFGTDAPSRNPLDEAVFLSGSDTIPDRDIVDYVSRKADRLAEAAENIEKNLSHVMDVLTENPSSVPPLSLPIEGIDYTKAGASTGRKLNPFYKVAATHEGIDLVAPQGTPVTAAGAGTVSRVEAMKKGYGNMVEIDHGNGYVTRYAHLAGISVSKGQKVAKGRKIGDVGMTGNTFAPHLHYEVRTDSTFLDPVDFFFASVGPREYANMMIMSETVGQSMD
ncbi:MAG: M23 family metallopeptidase [Bacteroidales bacterium]|nr:M23 family metallopeptidase [Bacteroidales bacterium]